MPNFGIQKSFLNTTPKAETLKGKVCITPASSAPLGHCDDAVMTIGVQASEFLVSTLGHRPSCGTGGHLVFYI